MKSRKHRPPLHSGRFLAFSSFLTSYFHKKRESRTKGKRCFPPENGNGTRIIIVGVMYRINHVLGTMQTV